MADLAFTIKPQARSEIGESGFLRFALIILAISFLTVVLLLPLIIVFSEALRKGAEVFFKAFTEPDTRAALRLTLLVAVIAVPFNMVFGVAASWAVTKFNFKGKSLLLTLID